MNPSQRHSTVVGRIVLACALLVVVITVGIGSGIMPVPEARAAVFTKPTNSSPIAISADNTLVWSVNPGNASVSVISTATNTVVGNITGLGTEPRSVALDPNNGFAYVASPASNQVTVIKITNSTPVLGTFAAAIDTTAGVNGKITTGAEPWDIVISPDGKRVFVSNSGQDTITVINTAGNTVIGNVDIANSLCNDPDRNRHFQPRGMAVTLDNTRLFVTRFLSFTQQDGGVQGSDRGKNGAVCRLNINTNSAVITDYTPAALIPLLPQVTGFKVDSSVPPDGVLDDTSAYPNQLQSIVIRGTRAFLPNIASSPSGPLRFNVDTQAFLTQLNGINAATQTDGGSLNLHLGAQDPEPGKQTLFFANPWGIAFTNQAGVGNAYVISAGSDLLVKLNVDANNNVAFTVDGNTTRYIDLNDPNVPGTSGVNAGKNPLGIVINDSTNTAYTMNFVSRNVSVVNLATDTVVSVIPTLALPAPGSQAERNLVGAEMFFSSRGVFDGGKVNRLSQAGWQNCASCHFDGWTDGTVWTFNAGPRKSIPLNGTFDPNNPAHQRVLNYSAIFDEIQDFEANIRNVSGPGNLPAPPAAPNTLDPNHGLLIGDDGNINNAPQVVNAFALPNAGRNQLTVTLPGSATHVPSLDALKEWVQNAVRTPNGRLTTTALTSGGGNATGGINPADFSAGGALFIQANCQTCHGGGQWTSSVLDFTPPPPGTQLFTETNPPAPAPFNPVGAQYLDRFLRNIGTFNLGVRDQPNLINNDPNSPRVGAREKATGDVQDALGFDFNNDGHGLGYSPPSLLGIFMFPPYYHNGSCETLACVVGNKQHRTGNGQFPDVLVNPVDQAKLVVFLSTIDKTSTPASPTPINTPQTCSPRPAFRLNVAPVGAGSPGKVQVTITPGNVNFGNTLQKIVFAAPVNSVVTANGQQVTGPFAVVFTPAVTSFQFTIQRTDNTKPVQVPYTITDTCGDFQTFAGFGTAIP